MKSWWYHIREGIWTMLTWGQESLYEKYKRLGFFDDYKGIASDWQAVGDYLREAMEMYEEEIEKEHPK